MTEVKSLTRLVVAFAAVALPFACGENRYEDKRMAVAPSAADAEVPTYHFITFGPGIHGLVGVSKNPTVRICLSGHTAETLDKWTDWIKDSTIKWLNPLRQFTTEPIASEVVVVTNSQSCDASFRIVQGAWGYTTIGNRPAITVGPNVPYGVVLHEFGHAFALSDTYQNGQSGNCRPGQPQSVMCNISFTDLQDDDRAGLAVVFGRRFPNDTPPPPPSDDSEEPSDPTDPSQPADPAPPQDPADATVDAFLALEPASAKGRFKFHLSLPAGIDADGVTYCVGEDTCEDGQGLWLSVAATNVVVGRQLFKTFESHKLTSPTVVTVKFGDGKSQQFRIAAEDAP